MNQRDRRFDPFAASMREEGLPEIFISTFARYYGELLAGQTGLIREIDIIPVATVPNMELFPASLEEVGGVSLSKTAVIKLNGGLGTGMGLEKAKSLLHVKQGYTFLDIIALQVAHAGVPLVLMNSFATDADSLNALEQYAEFNCGLPLSFVQHKEPKIKISDFSPAAWPKNPELEWCPPGHGDIYTALISRGTLKALLDAGYEYAFVSNADNLGAVLDLSLLGYFVKNELPFMMEVADRTEIDKKGGHLARSKTESRLILRESAQCAEEDVELFQDIKRHKYFNTNNLWINLHKMGQTMANRNNQLGLPMMRNRKTVDPRDGSSTPVFQLETAMGSAIGVFAAAQAVRVPRSRFAPVKSTNDLLAVRSDAYCLSKDFQVTPNPKRSSPPPVVDLDGEFYKFVSGFDSRFAHGVPSLLNCDRLRIVGDFRFGKGVVCHGSVELVNDSVSSVVIPDGALLDGEKHG